MTDTDVKPLTEEEIAEIERLLPGLRAMKRPSLDAQKLADDCAALLATIRAQAEHLAVLAAAVGSLRDTLPMAKGYAYANMVGTDLDKIDDVEAALEAVDNLPKAVKARAEEVDKLCQDYADVTHAHAQAVIEIVQLKHKLKAAEERVSELEVKLATVTASHRISSDAVGASLGISTIVGDENKRLKANIAKLEALPKRTPGTVEVCENYLSHDCADNNHWGCNDGSLRYACKTTGCHLKATRAEVE